MLTDQEAPRYFVDTGDDELSLIRDFPIALRMDAFISYNDLADKRADFNTPYLLKLLSGGALTKNIAYYFYFYMDERGEIAGVEYMNFALQLSRYSWKFTGHWPVQRDLQSRS